MAILGVPGEQDIPQRGCAPVVEVGGAVPEPSEGGGIEGWPQPFVGARAGSDIMGDER